VRFAHFAHIARLITLLSAANAVLVLSDGTRTLRFDVRSELWRE